MFVCDLPCGNPGRSSPLLSPHGPRAGPGSYGETLRQPSLLPTAPTAPSHARSELALPLLLREPAGSPQTEKGPPSASSHILPQGTPTSAHVLLLVGTTQIPPLPGPAPRGSYAKACVRGGSVARDTRALQYTCCAHALRPPSVHPSAQKPGLSCSRNRWEDESMSFHCSVSLQASLARGGQAVPPWPWEV